MNRAVANQDYAVSQIGIKENRISLYMRNIYIPRAVPVRLTFAKLRLVWPLCLAEVQESHGTGTMHILNLKCRKCELFNT